MRGSRAKAASPSINETCNQSHAAPSLNATVGLFGRRTSYGGLRDKLVSCLSSGPGIPHEVNLSATTSLCHLSKTFTFFVGGGWTRPFGTVDARAGVALRPTLFLYFLPNPIAT